MSFSREWDCRRMDLSEEFVKKEAPVKSKDFKEKQDSNMVGSQSNEAKKRRRGSQKEERKLTLHLLLHPSFCFLLEKERKE